MSSIHTNRAAIQQQLDTLETQRQQLQAAAQKNFEIEKKRLEENDRQHTDGGNADRLQAQLAELKAAQEQMVQDASARLDAQAQDLKAQQQLLEQQQRAAEDLARQDALAQNEHNFREQEEMRQQQRQEDERRRQEEERRHQEENRSR